MTRERNPNIEILELAVDQLGAHNGDDFSRQQAQAVLGMTVSLLSAPEVGVLK